VNSFLCSNCGAPLASDQAAECHTCGTAVRLSPTGIPNADESRSPQAGGSFHPENTQGEVAPPRPMPAAERLSSAASAAASSDKTEGYERGRLGAELEAMSQDDWEIGRLLAPPEGPDELGRLGPYRVVKVLGVGGMGAVFEAEDPMLGRNVALKALLPSVAAKTINRQRFLREARATAALRHDHIVAVYNAGEDRGIPFLVMELLEGEPLNLRLDREGRLPIDDVLRIGLETAEGLAAAHEYGLVHRDVKPGNIWLERLSGRVKILDFGLARSVAEDVLLTHAGTVLGTPAYMAPEQARGEALDHRCDLFSLGIVIYQMCTGELPFKGSDTLAILLAIVRDKPPPIYERNPDVPTSLANLVTWLLAKEADERPATARAVCEALAAIRREQSMGDILGLGEAQVLLDGEDLSLDESVEEGTAQSSPVVAATSESPRLLPDRLDELAGHTLGRYVLRSVLGHGHYGRVFRARDSNTGKLVALKVLSSDFPQNPREIQRFSQAMKAGLVICHPNLVAIRAVGKTGPYCWIAQEFIEGQSLATVVEQDGGRRPLDWKLAFRVARDIGRALQATARRRLIHGNVTPRNILVRSADQAAKLNDFMLLCALNGSKLHRDVIDEKLRVELPYMAPEQVDGKSPFIDHLCDLYSLGGVLYLLLTGRPPFQGRSVEETRAQICETAPNKPRKYQRSIPREFERMVLKMLAKRQENRCQSPDELLADLERIADKYGIPE
jgi:serine/threonine protein kinase